MQKTQGKEDSWPVQPCVAGVTGFTLLQVVL